MLLLLAVTALCLCYCRPLPWTNAFIALRVPTKHFVTVLVIVSLRHCICTYHTLPLTPCARPSCKSAALQRRAVAFVCLWMPANGLRCMVASLHTCFHHMYYIYCLCVYVYAHFRSYMRQFTLCGSLSPSVWACGFCASRRMVFAVRFWIDF